MAIRSTNKVRVLAHLSTRSIIQYSVLGLATGTIVCFMVFFITDQFSSIQVKARTYSCYISENNSICQGDTVSLKAYGGDLYEWSPAKDLDNVKSSSPIASPKKTTIYTATIYKKQEPIFNETGRHLITSELLNSKERIFYRKELKLTPNTDYLLTLTARTLSALDKGLVEVIVNRKLAGRYFINNYFRNGLEYIWNSQSSESVTLTLLLTHFDGDGDIVEIAEFSVRPVVKTTLNTTVTVRTDCSKCKAPEILSYKMISANTASIILSTSGNAMIRYKKEDDSEWRYIETTKNTLSLDNLQSDADYIIEAASVCDKSKSEKSDWSAPFLIKSNDRILEKVLAEKETIHKGISTPVLITPDSSGTHLHTYFKIDSPDNTVRLEVIDAAGSSLYSNYVGIDNNIVQHTLALKKSMPSGTYILRITDGTKTYDNQFEVE